MVVQKDLARNTDTGLSSKSDIKKHRLKQRFDVRQKLGQGTYGKVQLAVNKETGQEVAIKTIKKSKIESEQDLIRIRREIQIMSSIQHPHIIHIYEVFENKDKIVLVMQFASGGELYDYLSEKKVLSDLEARRIFRQIAAAVYYCHKNKICHRDLKLENILLDEKGNAKIADFGLSNVFDERHLLKTYCGSPLYASPEIVKGVPYYGPEVDCWSMGVLLYTLVYGAMPFDGSNFKKLVTQISEGDYFEPKKKSKSSVLIHKLLTVNPLKRATIVDICTDNWVNQGYEHSLLQVAEDMANLTPVRLDLLLALAPASPIPTTDDDDFREEESKQKDEEEDVASEKTALEKEEEEEEEEDEEENPETATNSFAFVRASQASNLSVSTPDIQQAMLEVQDYEEDEFLPADIIAALENHCSKRGPERSFDGSLARISSMAHKSKKPRKSDSMVKNRESATTIPDSCIGNDDKESQNVGTATSKKCIQSVASSEVPDVESLSDSKLSSQEPVIDAQVTKSKSHTEVVKESSIESKENSQTPTVSHVQKNTEQDKLKPDVKKRGRSPGKIIIPKTFESPQSTPSPKAQVGKSSPTTPPSAEIAEKNREMPSQRNVDLSSQPQDMKSSSKMEPKSPKSDSSSDMGNPEPVSEEKKQIAKGILKKGIAKAKLAERKLSQQSSTETEVASPLPVKSVEAIPSFYKAPKPYAKEEEKQVQSKAEIVLSPPAKADITNFNISDSKAPLWDSAVVATNKQNRNPSWGNISSTIDSEMNNWREQMEESLKRLSPENEREKSITSNRTDEDEHLVPITRSYKKFTFTKDGACITETKKIYTTPGADGSWTKVEKKTKITTRPGNAEEFEKFRDLHLRNDSPITRSDSQSSSGSNEVYDDIFDSWTGDTMMCNMMKVRNMFQKFSRDPFLRTERRRNPFRNFRRTESDRSERSRLRTELRSGHSTDKDSSDNDEDIDISFDNSNPVVYGSQGLWQFLRSSNKRIPRRVTMVDPEHSAYARSVSQDRSDVKLNNWKRNESRGSSGYNTGSRSQSRDRTQSPHEKVLRFVFESPSQAYGRSASPTRKECWSFKKPGARHNPRRDSGVGSDGYESEHSYRRVPSDDLSKSGRVSPVYNSNRQGMIHEFVKSWPKEMVSPRDSLMNDASGNFSDSRRHKVEQWLHMNDMNEKNFPFGFHSDPHAKMSAARKSSLHDNKTSYATMRPRDFMMYNRSSSDKINDCSADYFTSFEDGPRAPRSPQIEAVRNRLRNVAYSPVSEESSRESQSLRHSDSSHSSSSVHRINFTISDGRVSTSLSPSPQSGSRPTQSFVVTPGEHVIESNSGDIRVEHVSNRNSGQPLVQMRVSINRGNRDNKVLHITSETPPASTGLWQQQESPRNLNTSTVCNSPREPSPVPGIKKFSTEMVHKVGSNEDNQTAENKRRHHSSNNTSIECEVKTSLKSSPGPMQKGKKPDTTFESSFVEAFPNACSQTNTENVKMTNINANPYFNQTSFMINPNIIDSAGKLSQINSSKGPNTPDSLDELSSDFCFGEKEAFHQRKNSPNPKQEVLPSDNFQLEIKPLGVLWNSYDSNMPEKAADHCRSGNRFQVEEESFLPNSCDVIQSHHPYPDALYQTHEARSRNNSGTAFSGSIWDQSNNNTNTLHFIKEMLSDDGLDNFSSMQFIPRSPEHSTSEQCIDSRMAENLPESERSHSLIEGISVIELNDAGRKEKFSKVMPSVMDDLRSPKEVLRHAIRINESLKTCE